jgi:uncharacterized protein YqcC (DUF446 family)
MSEWIQLSNDAIRDIYDLIKSEEIKEAMKSNEWLRNLFLPGVINTIAKNRAISQKQWNVLKSTYESQVQSQELRNQIRTMRERSKNQP